MSDLTLKIFGAAVLSVLAIVVIRKQSPDTATTLRLVAAVMLASVCVLTVTPIVEYVEELAGTLGGSETMVAGCEVLLKALGISILTHVTAGLCRDAGEGSIAYYVELGGKIEILLLSLPLIREMIDTTLELVEMSR